MTPLRLIEGTECTCPQRPRPCKLCRMVIKGPPHYRERDALKSNPDAYCLACGESLLTIEALA